VSKNADTRLSPRDVTEIYAIKIVVKHTQNGTVMQWEVAIFAEV
jgi:hypothetical protein